MTIVSLDHNETEWARIHLIMAMREIKRAQNRDEHLAAINYAWGILHGLEMCSVITKSSAERCRALVDAWVYHERGCAY